MKNFMFRYKKGIAVFLVVCVIVTMIPVLANFQDRVPISASDANDKKIAADVSTSTGVDVETVLSLKKDGKSWNEILEYLKDKEGSTKARDEMNMSLTDGVFGEEDVEVLLDEGFTREEIQQATLIAERVQFQLQEITSSNGTENIANVQTVPEVGKISDAKSEKMDDYKKLEEKFNIKTVVAFMLKLKDSFEGMNQVMDEYLYSLQVDINLDDYLVDTKAYLEMKREKSFEVVQKTIITMSDIETTMLEVIQQNNVNDVINEVYDSTINPSNNEDLINDDGWASPLPEMKDVTPKNPAEDILEEIQQINPLQ